MEQKAIFSANETTGLEHKRCESKEAKGSSSDTRTEKELMWRAVDFVSKELLVSLDAFFIEYVPLFTGAKGKDIEHKLEWTTAYEDYERLFNLHLEGFAKREGFEKAEDFYLFVAEAQSESKSVAKMVKLFVARADYQKFVAMMNRRALIAGAKEEY
jgi:hypothetical protein